MRPANSTSGSASRGVSGAVGPGVVPSQHRHLAAQPLLAQPLGVQLARSRTRAGGRARTAAARARRPPADAAEVVAPVVAAPHLEPVDHQLEARRAAARAPPPAARSTGRGGVHDLVAAAVAEQMPQARPARTRAAAGCAGARPRVYSAMRGPAATTRTRPSSSSALAALPLAQRQVGDLVALGRQALGEVAIPALGAPDGVGEEAVVDDADAHRASIHLAEYPRHFPPARAL